RSLLSPCRLAPGSIASAPPAPAPPAARPAHRPLRPLSGTAHRPIAHRDNPCATRKARPYSPVPAPGGLRGAEAARPASPLPLIFFPPRHTAFPCSPHLPTPSRHLIFRKCPGSLPWIPSALPRPPPLGLFPPPGVPTNAASAASAPPDRLPPRPAKS